MQSTLLMYMHEFSGLPCVLPSTEKTHELVYFHWTEKHHSQSPETTKTPWILSGASHSPPVSFLIERGFKVSRTLCSYCSNRILMNTPSCSRKFNLPPPGYGAMSLKNPHSGNWTRRRGAVLLPLCNQFAHT